MSTYISGRKQYARPQAMIWCDQPPTIQDNLLLPVGYEIGIDPDSLSDADLLDNRFLITSDHNRSSLSMQIERIEQKKRMVNGTMRSYHVADKTSISVDWDMLPSRSFQKYPNFNQTTGGPVLVTGVPLDDAGNEVQINTPYGSKYYPDQKYTVDGGAGGMELLDWYENHTGPFWVMLSYDKFDPSSTTESDRLKLGQYTQVLQMYIDSFDYSITKRGGNNFDMWDVSVTLEEV